MILFLFLSVEVANLYLIEVKHQEVAYTGSHLDMRSSLGASYDKNLSLVAKSN